MKPGKVTDHHVIDRSQRAPVLVMVPVGWSRVVLRAHAAGQMVAGSLVGRLVMSGFRRLLQGWLV